MPDPRTVIAVNYHRIGATDPANPFHRLHAVPEDEFLAQLDLMQGLGQIVSPDQVRRCEDLASLNFVVCFDDVPISALEGIAIALERGLPVTVSVCGQLASEGRGTRDKVYAIERYASPAVIRAHIRSRLPGQAGENDPPSFYQLTKSADLHPTFVLAELIKPLFETLDAEARAYVAERGYLSWEQAGGLAADPLVTVANHTLGHDNLAALPAQAIHDEIRLSHDLFTTELGFPARYFTIPFGQFSQELALDCLDPLTALGYAGILWVGDTGIIVRGPYRSQVLHLPRLHAAPTADALARQIRHAIRDSLDSLIWQGRPTAHRRPVTVTAASDSRRSCLLEMVMRQGKDYASDPDFYKYQFTDNPYKGDRPDYYAAECDGRIEATAYNFHASFAVEGTVVPGVYLSSWRKLPHCHPAAAARLVQAMIAREAIVGAYRPNPAVHRAFTGWHQAHVHQLSIPVTAIPREGSEQGYEAIELPVFPAGFGALCSESVASAGFTVARDGAYQRWRHDSYPLADTTYLALYHCSAPAAIAVVMHTRHAVSVEDFHLQSPAQAAHLIRAVLAWAAGRDAVTVEWQASSQAVAQVAIEEFSATSAIFCNFYHFNGALLADLGVAEGLSRRWPSLPLHETGTTSDVLLR
ncbi:MAG TPA: polysaccharide deacetylase family protein [Streptosporangiaceae bacterium]|nr:polysaccharide deacetylase family protein [Streptosporangiaceae bacterium]